MTFATGNTVGPYRIIEQIGQGGMATVFKAYHANLDRFVAFKVLHPAFKEDPNFVQRFNREAQIVAKLEHPSIVPVYDYADLNGQPYLVMKFIEGETLKARLKREPLSLTETFQILEVVADALTYAHEQGILHRDIKPSNIMLDNNGTPYITDFGLARIAQVGETTMSQDMMLGTPQYISPEQAKGLHDLGPGTDIYSLGVVLYEVVVGRVPFSADTPYAIIHDHIYKPLPMPSQVNPEVPPEVERVLLKALAKEPQDRYETAIDMVAAFRQSVEAAGVTELSAARYRPSNAYVSPTAPTQLPGLPGSAPTAAPVYTVVPSPVAATGSSASRQRARYRRRANLWILSGLGSLLLICLASLFIIVDAVRDPDLRPWDTANKAGAEENVMLPETDPPAVPTGMSLEEAESMVADDPENPSAHMAVTMAMLESGDTEAAYTNLVHTIDQFEISSEGLAAIARTADAADYTDLATWLYLEALVQDELPLGVRNEAGEFLYDRIQNEPVIMRTILRQFLDRRIQAAPIYTMQALALLEADRRLAYSQAEQSINAALEMDDTLAETYFARGLLQHLTGHPDQAETDLQRVTSFSDAPDWVLREARRLLQME
ncbi:MAG: serine/threonine protein kinase [Anaerolineae bacterium]|nr:serine/threonine protein kinase [Anaerolineae bacterium]